MNDIKGLIEISKYAGSRFDIVQAGGGNTSVKINNSRMLIKASGFSLSEVDNDRGYVEVNNNKIIDILCNEVLKKSSSKKEREQFSKDALAKCNVGSTLRPSIETFLHAILGKYTLHTHPVVVNMIVTNKDWKEICHRLFPDALLVEYNTPGIELAIEMNNALVEYKNAYAVDPEVIFLQNHGLIVCGSNANDVIVLHEKVLYAIEQHLGLDFEVYHAATNIAASISTICNRNVVAYTPSDSIVLNYAFLEESENINPFCPDTLVYCGMHILNIDTLCNNSKLKEYFKQYNDYPKVIRYKKQTYFIADSIKKARDIEELFKFHSIVVQHNPNYTKLNNEELLYLNNWDAEKFRKTI